PRPLLLLVLLRDIGRPLRQVANVTNARLDDEAVAQIPLDRPRLGRRLDDDEPLVLSLRSHRRATIPSPDEVEYTADAAHPSLQRRRSPLVAPSPRPLPARGPGGGEPAGRGRVRARVQALLDLPP